MGFGILFIGYFLLLNVTYFSFTDVLVGLIISLAFNKLSGINKYFKLAQLPSLVFSLLGLLELGVAVYTMFWGEGDLALYNIAIGFVRYLLIGIFTLLLLLGIEDVSKEVELARLQKKARASLPFSMTVLLLGAIFEMPFLSRFIESYTLTAVAFVLLCGFMIIVILNLTVIYGAYMNICMPSQLTKTEKKSKFKLVEKFKEHEEMRQREYVEYKMNKRKGKKK